MVLLLMQLSRQLAFLVMMAFCWFIFNLVSTTISRSFTAGLLISLSASLLLIWNNEKRHQLNFFLQVCKRAHIDTNNRPRFSWKKHTMHWALRKLIIKITFLGFWETVYYAIKSPLNTRYCIWSFWIQTRSVTHFHKADNQDTPRTAKHCTTKLTQLLSLLSPVTVPLCSQL